MQNDRFDNIHIPEQLNTVVAKGLIEGKKIKKNMHRKTILLRWGSAAAVVLVILLFFSVNPSLAAKIPLIGRIFRTVEEDIGYKGNYSENATVLEKNSEEETEQSKYQQTFQGVTVTISEVTATKQALYLAISIENEEAFPQDFIRTKTMEGYILDYDMLYLNSLEKYDVEGLDEDDLSGPYMVEGQFLDDFTFAGVIRVSLDNRWWPSEEELLQADIKGENYDVDSEYMDAIQSHFPKAGETIEIPNQFKYTLQIKDIYADLNDKKEIVQTNDLGEETIIWENIKKHYKGEWNFVFDIKIDESKNQIVQVNDTNESGVGISKVEKSTYEIRASMILPKEVNEADYITVICDAEGNKLEYQGDNAEVFSTFGRDTSKVYVYVCDYIQYMDELKMDSQKIAENALFETEVVFTQ